MVINSPILFVLHEISKMPLKYFKTLIYCQQCWLQISPHFWPKDVDQILVFTTLDKSDSLVGVFTQGAILTHWQRSESTPCPPDLCCVWHHPTTQEDGIMSCAI